MTPDQVRGRLWAQRLKRVFNIDVNACGHCGGRLRIVASIEEPTPIRAILGHFAKHGALEKAHYPAPPRAHRTLWPRDIPPATKPVLSTVEGPKAKQGKTTRSGNESAGPRSARFRESARNGHGR